MPPYLANICVRKASCITAPWSILLSLTASNVKGNTKRSVVNAMFFIGYCAGCIGGPQLWTEKPRYFAGVVAAIFTWCLLVVTIITYRFLCVRENARRDDIVAGQEHAQVPRSGEGELDERGGAKGDLTDKMDTEFRYSY